MTPLAWLALSTLAFEPNVGQTDPQVQFLARGPGYTLFLTSTEAVLARPGSAVRMKLAGANPAPRLVPLEPQAGYSSYALGSWRGRAPRYGRLRYERVYPGVDLVYYGRQGELEYDLVVAPGADPRVIRLVFDGVRGVRLEGSGDLVLEAARLARPVVYQKYGEERRAVSGRYVVRGRREVGFEVGPYDRSRPLVIDPILRFATYLGGGADDVANGVAVDPGGNIYVFGSTASANFPRFPGGGQGPPAGGRDLFLTKLTPAGAGLSYSTYLGGNGDEAAAGIAVDAAGNVYLAGTTTSNNFPAATGALRGPSDAFLVRLDPNGGVQSSAFVGGSAADSGAAVALDGAGNIYLAGSTASPDFPTTPGAVRTFSAGGTDVFVVKVGAVGTVSYATLLGGVDSDTAAGLAADGAGNVWVTGGTLSANFPTTNAHQPACAPSQTVFTAPCADAFLAKLNPAGSALVFSTYLGGRAGDGGRAVAVDAAGNAYLTGVTSSFNFPTAGALAGAFQGGPQDAFVAKFSATGSLTYSNYLGGSGEDLPGGIVVDGSGAVWVAGSTTSTNFPTERPLQAACPNPCADAFLAQLNPSGSALGFSTFLGGLGVDRAHAVALDTFGSVYLAGETGSANFPVTPLAFQTQVGGRTDAFLVRIGEPNPVPAVTSLVPTATVAGGFSFELTVHGSNFVPGAVVRWNGSERPTTQVSSTQLAAFVTASDIATPGTAQVTVTNPAPGGGVSGALTFTIRAPGAPHVTALSPSTTLAGDPGFTLGVTGSAFTPSSVVRWNDADRATTFASETQLAAAIPAADVATAGTAQVTVVNPLPGGGTSAAVAFQILNPAPVLTALSPAAAPAGSAGIAVTVTGSRFLPTSVVRWNGANRTTSFVSAGELRVLIPPPDLAGAGAAQVTVFNPTPGGGSSGIVTFTITPAPVISPGGIVNAASFSTQPLAAGTIAAVFGSNLAAATAQASSVPLPTTLGGATLRVEGIEAPLFFVSPLQINFVVPWELEGRALASVVVTSAGVASAAQTVSLAPAAPALFATNQRGSGQGAVLISGTASLAAPRGAFPGSRPAARGEYLELYAIGLGAVANPPATGAAAGASPLSTTTAAATVSIGGVAAPVVFSGLAAGFVGLYQINTQVPPDAPAGGAVPVVLTIGGVASNTVTVAVE